MGVFFKIIYFVLGLCVGSFINMAVYRTAGRYGLIKEGDHEGRPYNRDRSFCDFCGKQLPWFENIPVVSWVIQGGKSRCCRTPLPWSYPVVELLMGIIFLVIGFNVVGWLIMSLLIFSGVFDAKYMILPDFSTYILIIVALIVGHNWLVAIGAAGLLLMLHVVTKGKGMGMGDVKLAIFMGLFLGWPGIVVAMYTAFISGAMVGLGLLMIGRKGRKSEIPFGPFLILGTVIAWYYGNRIWEIVQSWVLL